MGIEQKNPHDVRVFSILEYNYATASALSITT